MNKKILFFIGFISIILLLFIKYTNRSDSDSISTDGSAASEEYEKMKIAITFDDGPGPYTERLLDGLLERNVKATFFLIGESAEQYPDVVKRMHEEGHLIGNHTYSHIELACVPLQKAVEEINKTNNIIKEITGEDTEYIRPPYGYWTKELAKNVDMEPILWDVDPRDWSVLDEQKVTCHIVKNIEEGDIILLHDIFETSVDAALNVIDILQLNGYEFVTVEELYG